MLLSSKLGLRKTCRIGIIYPEKFKSHRYRSLKAVLPQQFFNDSGLFLDEIGEKRHEYAEMLLSYAVKDYLTSLQVVKHLDTALGSHLVSKANPDWSRLGRSDIASAIWLADSYTNKSKNMSIIHAECSEALKAISTKLRKERVALLKSYRAIEKCNLGIEKALSPVHCKLCMQLTEIEDLANHTFRCFEKEIVHGEVIMINKRIVKLSTNCANLKTRLGSICLPQWLR